MNRFIMWWKTDKRYIFLGKILFMALLPILCCVVRCAIDGKNIFQVWLPGCQWNDELFYFKQVEAILQHGFPQGYYGFNESHALKLSFAAWSPVLAMPWVLWGAIFGWNLMSPILCNITLLSVTCICFVILTRPNWKQIGIFSVLFCLYTPIWRYVFSAMPEVICICMVSLFYCFAIRYTRKPSGSLLAVLFIWSFLMTLMRPYFLLFMLLPIWFMFRKYKWKGLLLSVPVVLLVMIVYYLINHFLSAEYLIPLFATDWIMAYFQGGIKAGLMATISKLYHSGGMFLAYTIEGFRSGLYAGTYLAAFDLMLLLLFIRCIVDFKQHRLGKKPENMEIHVHITFSFVAIFAALVMMYVLPEASRHMISFMCGGILVISMMDTKHYVKPIYTGLTFLYFFVFMAKDPLVYEIPYFDQGRQENLTYWEQVYEEYLEVSKDSVPGYENTIIWVLNDDTDEAADQVVKWQYLYSLPEGFGISCCQKEYLVENFSQLKSRYMLTLSGGELDQMCMEAGYEELGRREDTVLYRLCAE